MNQFTKPAFADTDFTRFRKLIRPGGDLTYIHVTQK